MRYISTRGGGEPLSFKQTVLAGLARDGGLYLPEAIPQVADRLEVWRGLDYSRLAFEIIRLFADDIAPDDLRRVVEKSYSVFDTPEVTPVRQVGPVHILELFHGPTLAFKDVALQFLGNLFELVLGDTGGEMNIVAATSGDTGSAAIYGVRGRAGIRIFVMHPHGRVSPVQERQMTTVLDSNVFNLAVDGTFDDCQNIVKELFGDLPFRDACKLGAVNSINWARVLAQVVYYFYAAFRVQGLTGAAKVRFSVPTGNFGDIFAGYVALKMGAPIERLVLATNENDILSRYFNTGVYSLGKVVPTLSPSMDIQVASNFERYLYFLAGRDSAKVAAWMAAFRRDGSLAPGIPPDAGFAAGRGDSAATISAIREFWTRYHYLLDPHTAVGVSVALERLNESSAPMVCLSTAHPAKFGAAIREATGEDLARHPRIDALMSLPARMEVIAADRAKVAEFVKSKLAQSC
ncbi:MAG: threonine synthase [Kiritimatiellae bacterium]|nr:threonine synthase [Kiritimatiellia bacterium]